MEKTFETKRKIYNYLQNNEDIYFYSLLGGMCGTLFFLDNKLKGFCIFSWTIVFIYCFILYTTNKWITY